MSKEETEERIERIQKTLGTLITWTAQASNSPISIVEASALLDMLEAPGSKKEPK